MICAPVHRQFGSKARVAHLILSLVPAERLRVAQACRERAAEWLDGRFRRAVVSTKEIEAPAQIYAAPKKRRGKK